VIVGNDIVYSGVKVEPVIDATGAEVSLNGVVPGVKAELINCMVGGVVSPVDPLATLPTRITIENAGRVIIEPDAAELNTAVGKPAGEVCPDQGSALYLRVIQLRSLGVEKDLGASVALKTTI
jgi:hypothetical protein